jgi:ankyrin repeat protein
VKKLLVLLAFSCLASDLSAQAVNDLMMAAVSGNTSEVERLIKVSGMDVNTIDDNFRMTPIMWAARGGRMETVVKLKELGADVNAKDRNRMTAVMWAALEGQTETMVKLKELGADLEIKSAFGRTAIMWAAIRGQTETIVKLLELGADINATGTYGMTALMFAAQNGQTGTAAKLIELGAGINVKANGVYGMTAIMFAASNGHTETVVKLKELGADLETNDNNGRTALTHADINGKTETSNKLKELGAVDYSEQEMLKDDARAYLSAYIGETNITDEEIALKTVLKFYENSLSDDRKEYNAAVAAITKEGNIDFLAGVKLGKYASVYNDYIKIVGLYKSFCDILSPEKVTTDSKTSNDGVLKNWEIEAALGKIKIELGRLRPLK